MSRVLTSKATGAVVHVFSDDHCPPHVHARHRGDGWIARVRFSCLGSAVMLSIAPLRNAPLQRTVNLFLADIEAALPACRRSWWVTKRTACLDNQWAIVRAPDMIEALPGPAPGAVQVAEATHDPEEERLQVAFRDGAAADASIRP